MVFAAAVAAAAVAAAASTTTALIVLLRLVTFRTYDYVWSHFVLTGLIILELATTTVVGIYLLSIMQSPAPASSLADPPPAASPQLGRWICQQGLRPARIRGLVLVFAAASAAAASTTTALAFLRLVTFCTGMTVLLLLLRLQPARDSRHTVCVGTSS